MKIKSVQIKNFKKFADLPAISFENPDTGEINKQFLILGDNGSGKTTILQAIALTLALATRQHGIRTIDDFDWIGFIPGRYARWGRPHVELEVMFSPDELEATRRVAKTWSQHGDRQESFTPPGDNPEVRLILDGDRCYAEGGADRLYQFRGRSYAAAIISNKTIDYQTRADVRQMLPQLPGIFWFDQFRNLGSSIISAGGEENGAAAKPSGYDKTYNFGVERLREYLNGWALDRKAVSRRLDYYDTLERLYQRVFPGRSFNGTELMLEATIKDSNITGRDYYFLLNDGVKTYDIAEMSAGEQAVFPVLYDFVRFQIANSVVLIDELDLNLHPSLAQQFLSQLPLIGPDCQFIYTSHSSAVSETVLPGTIHRLSGVL